MEIVVEDLEGDAKYITLTGALDISGIPEIEVKLAALAGHHKNIIVDLSGVDYIASIGIGVLVKNAQTVTRHGGKFLISQPSQMVEEILRTMVIDKVIPIHATRDDAVAAVSA